MIKVYCDKCGKEVGEFEAYTVLVEAPEIKSWTDQYIYERRGYQVCRDCMAKVADFIESKPTKKFEDELQTEGEWIEINIKDYKAKCSHCGTWSPIMGNFCPYCGARMKGA